MLYLSADVVFPVLEAETMSLKLVPSLETDMTKLYDLTSPLYQAMSIAHNIFLIPKSSWTNEPTALLAHLVSGSPSTANAAVEAPLAPFAPTFATGNFSHISSVGWASVDLTLKT